MTHHLSTDELVAVLDRHLDAGRRQHFDGCDACRAAVADLEATFARVAVADVPEPSPLFWDHLSARIQAATAAEPMAVGAPASRSFWRPVVAVAAAAVVVLAVVMSRAPAVPPPGIDDRSVAVSTADGMSDDAPWTTMAGLAEAMSADDVRLLVGAAPETPAITELTATEREAFVRLLGEMGGLE
jgi:hypothetical protein